MSITNEQRAEIKQAFDAFDTDRSGRISCKEFGNLMESLGETLTEDQIKMMVATIDTDGSGEIEFDEFVNFFSQFA